MEEKDGLQLLSDGIRAVEAGNYAAALASLEMALSANEPFPPTAQSAYAVCIAAVNKDLERAVGLCRKAIAVEPCETVHYLQLGRVYLVADKRQDAIRALREGLLYRRDERITRELERIGVRRKPLFDDLARSHPLNRLAGRILGALRFR